MELLRYINKLFLQIKSNKLHLNEAKLEAAITELGIYRVPIVNKTVSVKGLRSDFEVVITTCPWGKYQIKILI